MNKTIYTYYKLSICLPGFDISFTICGTTPDRQQSKILLTIDKHGSKIVYNSIFDYHLSPSGDKLQSQSVFLTIFNLPSSIVITLLIAPYPVWEQDLENTS